MRNFLSSLFFAAAAILPATSFAAPVDVTRLRVTESELKYTPRSSRTVTMSAVAKVRNVGTVEAKGVRVVAKLPDGQTEEMKGPETLAPNANGVYTYSASSYVMAKGKLDASVTCDNCRK